MKTAYAIDLTGVAREIDAFIVTIKQEKATTEMRHVQSYFRFSQDHNGHNSVLIVLHALTVLAFC